MFELDARLDADTAHVADLSLSRILLMNDIRFPWLILVPMRVDLRELHDLDPVDRMQLMEEVAVTSRLLTNLYKPDKINVGALGNLVQQLHLHIICRFSDDDAWPGPVWGNGQAVPYQDDDMAKTRSALAVALMQR